MVPGHVRRSTVTICHAQCGSAPSTGTGASGEARDGQLGGGRWTALLRGIVASCWRAAVSCVRRVSAACRASSVSARFGRSCPVAGSWNRSPRSVSRNSSRGPPTGSGSPRSRGSTGGRAGGLAALGARQRFRSGRQSTGTSAGSVGRVLTLTIRVPENLISPLARCDTAADPVSARCRSGSAGPYGLAGGQAQVSGPP